MQPTGQRGDKTSAITTQHEIPEDVSEWVFRMLKHPFQVGNSMEPFSCEYFVEIIDAVLFAHLDFNLKRILQRSYVLSLLDKTSEASQYNLKIIKYNIQVTT